PLLQQVEEAHAADATEPMTTRGHHLALVEDIDVVPMGEAVENAFRAYGVVAAQIGHGLVGKDHAPAESVVRAVALDDRDIVLRIPKFHGDCEIEPGRPATNAHDLHTALLYESN